jgi:hypothetical protein
MPQACTLPSLALRARTVLPGPFLDPAPGEMIKAYTIPRPHPSKKWRGCGEEAP